MTRLPIRRFLLLAFCTSLAFAAPARAQAPARNIIVITLDGARWQEVFGGADRDYFKRDKEGSGGPAERRFWRESAAERRAVLMPFLWNTIARQGQVFGDPGEGSLSHVTNGLWFSYPGYNELLAGVADTRVNSNDKVPNPNVTVLEWLNTRPGFSGKVAAFGSWDVLPSILNVERSKLVVGTSYEPSPGAATVAGFNINALATDLPRYWEYGPFDAPIVYAALDRLRTAQPRVLYILLGETDEWAHEGRYDLYLDAMYRSDRFIERLWTAVQSMPGYAGTTALAITTDHGRGATTQDWNDHGRDVPAAERTWMAFLGPGVPPLGARKNTEVTTSQFAATIASLLGENFRAAVPAAAPPVTLKP